MRYYTVPAVGIGTIEDPTRPDLPDGTSFVGAHDPDGTYLIATPAPLPSKPGRVERPAVAELSAEATRRGLDVADIEQWYVG